MSKKKPVNAIDILHALAHPAEELTSYMSELGNAMSDLQLAGTPEELRKLQREISAVLSAAAHANARLHSAIDHAEHEREIRRLQSVSTVRP